MSHVPSDERSAIPGGQPQEPVEDRPNVGSVTPEDYPDKDRAAGLSGPPLDEEKEQERLNPGSGGKAPEVPGRGHDRDNA